MAGDDLPEGDVNEVAVLVDHGVESVDVAEALDDLQLLLVQRIADEVALHRKRIFHEARRMEGADGFMMGDARRHHLAAARPAGHEMRLHQAGGDPKLRFRETAVDADRRAAGGRDAEIDMGGVIPREMVLDADVGQHPGIAHQFGEFGAFVRAMQAGRHQDGDGVSGMPSAHHRLDHRAKEQVVRHRARDVADQDAGAATALRQKPQGRRGDRASKA